MTFEFSQKFFKVSKTHLDGGGKAVNGNVLNNHMFEKISS